MQHIKKTTAIILCLLWYSTLVYAGTLPEQIDNLLSDQCLSRGIQGVVVKSLKTGEILYQHNPDTLLIPASNLKLFTSAAALDLLGPGFNYTTRVYATTCKDDKGVVYGDLVLRGSGDPAMTTADLTALARKIRGMGVSKITGSLIVDDTLFDNQKLGWGWGWDDLPYYYAAPVGALNLNRNVVEVYIYPGKSVGAKATIRTTPATDCIRIESTAITGSIDSQKSTWVYRKAGSNTITVGGSIPFKHSIEAWDELITIEDPAQYTGHVFRTELAKQGVRVVGNVKAGRTPDNAELLVMHHSPPLSDIIALMNKLSDNMIAETLLRTIGAERSGKGSTEAGINHIMQFCEKIGIDTTGISLTDGSGLARRNFVTAYSMIALLCYMHSHKHSKAFVDSLPIAGVDGTLRNRMKGTPAQNRVRAKSGYVSNVSTLSGYATTTSGDMLAFSILLNNHLCTNDEAKAVQDRICEAIASLP